MNISINFARLLIDLIELVLIEIVCLILTLHSSPTPTLPLQVKSLEAERDMLMASVRSLAEFNLARQADYESDRSKLLSLVGDSNQLKDCIQEKATKLLELSRKTSLESTLAVVLAATVKSEEESEAIAKELLDKTLDFDSFVSQYCEKRKLAHLRRIKVDRLRLETNESWTGIRSQSFGPLSQ